MHCLPVNEQKKDSGSLGCEIVWLVYMFPNISRENIHFIFKI